VQLAIGSSGVPETFVIDGKGVIRYQHIGDIRPEARAAAAGRTGGGAMIRALLACWRALLCCWPAARRAGQPAARALCL
jgi:hypothetical protein